MAVAPVGTSRRWLSRVERKYRLLFATGDRAADQFGVGILLMRGLDPGLARPSTDVGTAGAGFR